MVPQNRHKVAVLPTASWTKSSGRSPRPTQAQVEVELVALSLLDYCQPAIDRTAHIHRVGQQAQGPDGVHVPTR
jgi:hypothetical protein